MPAPDLPWRARDWAVVTGGLAWSAITLWGVASAIDPDVILLRGAVGSMLVGAGCGCIARLILPTSEDDESPRG